MKNRWAVRCIACDMLGSFQHKVYGVWLTFGGDPVHIVDPGLPVIALTLAAICTLVNSDGHNLTKKLSTFSHK